MGGAGLSRAQSTQAPAVTPRVAPRLDEEALTFSRLDCLLNLRDDTLNGVSSCEVVVARVLAARDGARPGGDPTALLQVEEVLHGDLSPGPVKAVWRVHRMSFSCGSDWDLDGPPKSFRVRGPKVGSRLIVAGDLNGNRRWLITSEHLRVPFTSKTRQAVLSRLKDEGLESAEGWAQKAWNPAEARAAVRDGELWDAVVAGDAQRVRSLLREGVRPTAHNGQGTRVLQAASARGSLEVMRILMEGGP